MTGEETYWFRRGTVAFRQTMETATPAEREEWILLQTLAERDMHLLGRSIEYPNSNAPSRTKNPTPVHDGDRYYAVSVRVVDMSGKKVFARNWQHQHGPPPTVSRLRHEMNEHFATLEQNVYLSDLERVFESRKLKNTRRLDREDLEVETREFLKERFGFFDRVREDFYYSNGKDRAEQERAEHDVYEENRILEEQGRLVIGEFRGSSEVIRRRHEYCFKLDGVEFEPSRLVERFSKRQRRTAS